MCVLWYDINLKLITFSFCHYNIYCNFDLYLPAPEISSYICLSFSVFNFPDLQTSQKNRSLNQFNIIPDIKCFFVKWKGVSE